MAEQSVILLMFELPQHLTLVLSLPGVGFAIWGQLDVNLQMLSKPLKFVSAQAGNTGTSIFMLFVFVPRPWLEFWRPKRAN